jgi:hypothetical protein
VERQRSARFQGHELTKRPWRCVEGGLSTKAGADGPPRARRCALTVRCAVARPPWPGPASAGRPVRHLVRPALVPPCSRHRATTATPTRLPVPVPAARPRFLSSTSPMFPFCSYITHPVPLASACERDPAPASSGVLRGHHVAADCSRLYIRASRIKKPRYNGAPSQDLVVNPAPAKTSPTCCGGASSPFGSKTRKAAASPSTRGLRASPVPRCSKLPMPSGVALSPSTASSSGRPSRVPRPSSLMPSPRRHLGELEEPGHGQVAAHVLHHHHHRQRPRRPHPRPNASDHPRVTSGGSPTSSPIRATCDSLPFRANEKCGRSRRG